MAEAFAPLSRWLWRSGKHYQEHKSCKGSSINALPEKELLELDTMKHHRQNIASSSRRGVKRKWQSREERKIDKEHDIVLVPSDDGCVSGSESDDSDWSIGWMEPHGSGFNIYEDGSGDSFAVLVPCYGRRCFNFEDDSKDNKVLGTIGNITDIYAATENKKYMEQWLSSLQNI